jgi:hypothetical protein
LVRLIGLAIRAAIPAIHTKTRSHLARWIKGQAGRGTERSDSAGSVQKNTKPGIEMELDEKMEIATGIDSLARVTVQVGINLKPGQQVIMLSPDGGVPIETLPTVLAD